MTTKQESRAAEPSRTQGEPNGRGWTSARRVQASRERLVTPRSHTLRLRDDSFGGSIPLGCALASQTRACRARQDDLRRDDGLRLSTIFMRQPYGGPMLASGEHARRIAPDAPAPPAMPLRRPASAPGSLVSRSASGISTTPKPRGSVATTMPATIASMVRHTRSKVSSAAGRFWKSRAFAGRRRGDARGIRSGSSRVRSGTQRGRDGCRPDDLPKLGPLGEEVGCAAFEPRVVLPDKPEVKAECTKSELKPSCRPSRALDRDGCKRPRARAQVRLIGKHRGAR